MPRKDETMFRPSFNVNESKVLLRLVLSVQTDPDDLESAIVKERMRTSLLRFLAVNGGLVLGGGSGEDMHQLQVAVTKSAIRSDSDRGKEMSEDEAARIMAEIEQMTGRN